MEYEINNILQSVNLGLLKQTKAIDLINRIVELKLEVMKATKNMYGQDAPLGDTQPIYTPLVKKRKGKKKK